MPVRHQQHIAPLRGRVVFRFADGAVVEAGADVVDQAVKAGGYVGGGSDG